MLSFIRRGDKQMLKVFGSRMCPDCEMAKKNLDYYRIDYEYVDINENLKNLKEFLKIRDSSPLFVDVKKNGSIGIPLLIDNDEITLDLENYLKSKGFTPIKEEKKTFCSLDGKGC